MNHFFILWSLLAVYLVATNNQCFSLTTTNQKIIGQQTVTTNHQGITTGHPSSTTTSTTTSTAFFCICSCCSGLGCKPTILRTFANSACTTTACKDQCKMLEPKNCDYTHTNTNAAYCIVSSKTNSKT